MKHSFLKIITSLWLALGCSIFAQAVPINIGVWYEFSQNGTDPAIGCPPADPSAADCIPSSGTPTQFAGPGAWTFSTVHGAILTVTDVFNRGDVLDIREAGNLIGTTSAPIGDTTGDCGDDPELCLADLSFSHGVFSIGSGTRSLTIFENAADTLPFGVAYFKVDLAPIPEPSSLALMLFAMAALAGVKRSRSVRS